MSDIANIVAALRQKAKSHYEACLQAIDSFESALQRLDSLASEMPGHAPVAVPEPRRPVLKPYSNRQIVLEVLAKHPGLTMKQLQEQTKLTLTQLKTVVYAQDSRDLFISRKGNGKAKYFLAEDSSK